MPGIPGFVEVLDFRHPAVSTSLRRLESFRDPVFSVDQDQWDLPSKRNFALWHAVQCGYQYILLLDDDIRGITPSLLCRAGKALADNSIVGAFVTDFPDTSIIGHIEQAVGVEVYPFMSGSCLFIDVESVSGPFPAIYNEDWLFMVPHIDRHRACSLGCICQVVSDPFGDPARAMFQEPGELIADSLFEMLGVGAYGKRFEHRLWGDYLSARWDWLNELGQRVVDRRHEEAIAAARARLAKITPKACVDYMGVLERPRSVEACPLREWVMKTESIHTVDGFTLSAVSHRTTSADIVVWLHGITVDKDEYLSFFRDGATWLEKHGISSLRFDFRGHGGSTGSSMDFSIVGQNYDVRAAIEAVQTWRRSSARIHLVGASFGAPPAIFGALKFASSVVSVFLISPVLSYQKTFLEPSTEWAAELFSKGKRNELDRTGKLYIDSKFCIGHRLFGEMEVIQPDRALGFLRQSVTVVHGDRDSMVPYHVSQHICAAIPNIRFVTLHGADHGYMKAGDEEGCLDESLANRQKVFELIKEQVER